MSLSKLSFGIVILFTAACSAGPGAGDLSSIGSGRGLIVAGGACLTSADCSSGLECETEKEDGGTSAVCVAHSEGRADDSKGATGGGSGGGTQSAGSDDDAGSAAPGACPPGTEAEVEHGVTSCKVHVEDGGAATPGAGAQGAACTTSAQCGTGLECEVQVEHGVTTSSCQPHGGGGK